MSYCRFSCNDFQSDVYAYASRYGGFDVHVAENRVVYDQPLPPPITDPTDYKASFLRHEQVGKLVDSARRESIGLSRDGEHLNVETLEDLRDLLLDLRHEGYRVPDHALEAIAEEMAEEEA